MLIFSNPDVASATIISSTRAVPSVSARSALKSPANNSLSDQGRLLMDATIFSMVET